MTHLKTRLMLTKETYSEMTAFALAPLSHWSHLMRNIPADGDSGDYDTQVTLNMFLLPFYLVLNTLSLAFGLFAAAVQTIIFPFQWLFALYKDKNAEVINQENTLQAENCEQQTWHNILEYGRWAPSPHNMQPWIFQLEEDNTTTLLYDPKRLLPGTNPTGSFMVVAFGMLVETLSIAAAPLGLDVKATYYNSNRLDANNITPQPLAKLELVNRVIPETLSRELIMKRQTSRLPYDGQALSPQLITELSSVAEHYGHKMGSSSEQSEVDWIVRLNADTMFFDMAQKVAREEVASWIRFSKTDAIQRADGLASYAMNVPGWQMWLFVHANWMFRIPGVYQLVRHSYEQTMAGTATVAWLSGPFENHKDWDNAGRMMARWWLTMTKHGVYLHPFGSIITNEKAHELMVDHFKDEQRDNDLWMLARLGKSEELPPRAQRIPLSDIVVSNNRYGTFSHSATSGTNVEAVQREQQGLVHTL